MALLLVVKGNKRSAGREAARRGISAKCRAKVNRGEIVCVVPCHAAAKVHRWFEQGGVSKKGRGYPPGTLLWFNRKSC